MKTEKVKRHSLSATKHSFDCIHWSGLFRAIFGSRRIRAKKKIIIIINKYSDVMPASDINWYMLRLMDTGQNVTK